MKYTVRLIIAALAASAALVSCTKDLAPGKSDTDSAAGTLRTVTVSFDTPTKSYLDGNQPRFSKGDSVLVSDGTALDTCAVDVVGKKTIIRTKLEGETLLSAVYPYTAAVFDNYGNLVDVKIPAIQTGKFADANICMANQSDQGNKDNLRFRNKVAILKFYADESIGVDTIRVSCAEGKIASGADTIVVTAPKVEKSQLSNPTQDPRIWYVAMHDIKDATSLTFESVTSTQGTVTKKPKIAGDGKNEISIGYIYSVFIPYYIKVKVNDTPETYQKWGYCNVGAFLPEEPGLYFAWGDTTGYRWDAEKKQFEGGHSFTWENTPFNNDSTAFNADYFATVRDEVCPNRVLALKYDAANFNWGGKWRMPTEEEFRTMYNATYFGWDDTDKGCYVYVPNPISDAGKCSNGDGSYTKSNALLFFPAAGGGTGEGLNNKGSWGYYRASSLFSDHNGYADYLYFRKDFHSTYPQDPYYRCSGLSIRPIYDDTISEDQPTTVTISAYSNGGTL